MATGTPATPISEKIWNLVKGFLISTCIAWVCWELVSHFAPLAYQQILTWQAGLNDWARGWAGPVVSFWGKYIATPLSFISPYLGISIFSVALKRLITLVINLIKKI